MTKCQIALSEQRYKRGKPSDDRGPNLGTARDEDETCCGGISGSISRFSGRRQRRCWRQRCCLLCLFGPIGIRAAWHASEAFCDPTNIETAPVFIGRIDIIFMLVWVLAH